MSRNNASTKNIIQSWTLIDPLPAGWSHMVGDELHYRVLWIGGERYMELKGAVTNAADQTGAVTWTNVTGPLAWRSPGALASQKVVSARVLAGNRTAVTLDISAAGHIRSELASFFGSGVNQVEFSSTLFPVLPR